MWSICWLVSSLGAYSPLDMSFTRIIWMELDWIKLVNQEKSREVTGWNQ